MYVIAVSEPLVLGIETSCDETGVAFVRGEQLLSDVIATSVDEQARFGGVVPEVASRAHVEALTETLEQARSRAGVAWNDIDAIAVTAGPGLVGALLVGVAAAQGIGAALDKPVYGVNHLASHIAVDRLVHGEIPQPCMALLVSGGHTSLLRVNDVTQDIIQVGRTLDDAAGEAFDKVARMLGLAFPGGPHIDAASLSGDPGYIDFPRGLTDAASDREHRHDFSFSGLKTAVSRWVAAANREGIGIPIADVAASFQQAVVDVLIIKSLRACAEANIDTLIIGGGVAANSRLREQVMRRGHEAGVTVRIPPAILCTDNGAMVASLGSALVSAGRHPTIAALSPDLISPESAATLVGFDADSSLPVELVSLPPPAR